MIIGDINKISKWSKKIVLLECDICKIRKEMKMKLYTSYGYINGEYYCRKCKLEKNNLEKYGVKNVFELDSTKEKIIKTNILKYGVENPSQSENIKKKIKSSKSKLDENIILIKRIKTLNEKYNVDNISQLESIKNKKKITCLNNNGVEYISQSIEFKEYLKSFNFKKYGVYHSFQSEIIKDKIKKTNLKKYGFENPTQSEIIKKKMSESISKKLRERIFEENNNLLEINNEMIFYCESCKNNYNISFPLFYKRRETNTEICTLCNPINKNISGKEISLLNYIKSIYKGDVISSYRDGLEIDIYLPELRIGFEFNGLYWHSDKFLDKYYHQRKSKYFSQKDIKIIHIWENDWVEKTKDDTKNDIKFIIENSSDINIIIKEPKLYFYDKKTFEENDEDSESFRIWK